MQIDNRLVNDLQPVSDGSPLSVRKMDTKMKWRYLLK